MQAGEAGQRLKPHVAGEAGQRLKPHVAGEESIFLILEFIPCNRILSVSYTMPE